jgi:RNA polymerase sigma-70 factor (ECF subfamily)
MSSESELVRRASQGDRGAFGSLVESHWARLVGLARSVVGEADAEDMVQDGLLRAWRKLPGLTAPAAFDRWVTRVVLRVCLRRFRGPRRGLVSLETVAEPAHEANPEPRIDAGRLLVALPPRQRAVMHLTVVEGLTDSEIAPLLGIAASSVRAHRRRARRRLEREVSARSTA